MSPLTFIFGECDQFGIVCRQLKTFPTSYWSTDTINVGLEVNRETNQLIVIIEDIRYRIEETE